MQMKNLPSIFTILLLACRLILGTPLHPYPPYPYPQPPGLTTVTVVAPAQTQMPALSLVPAQTLTAPTQQASPGKCIAVKCMAALSSLGVSCTLVPFTFKEYAGYLWCAAMLFNNLENVPAPCTTCPILHSIAKSAPLIGAVGISGSVLFAAHKISTSKIKAEAAQLVEDAAKIAV